jgi:hypothetical protein
LGFCQIKAIIFNEFSILLYIKLSRALKVYHFGEPGLNGRIILKWTLKIGIGSHGLDCSGSGEGQVAGFCECGNEPSGCIKCGDLRLAEDLLTSQEGLCSMELVS